MNIHTMQGYFEKMTLYSELQIMIKNLQQQVKKIVQRRIVI